jgi:predicted RNA polymerase sigma factor
VTGTTDIEGLLRAAAPPALGVLVRRFGDFADCEDAVQEALIAASSQWPAQGVPDNPIGWVVHVASRRITDQRRAEGSRRRREATAAALEPPPAPPIPDGDDTLLLMLMCCHPALSPAAAIPLALRSVAGLSTAEIARAFLVPEATMAQRISRAKQRVRAAPAPFAPPDRQEFDDRLRSVMHMLYLAFDEGYLATAGTELERPDLSAEAIRLTRSVHAAMPGDPEVTGLLALMLLNHARRDARVDAEGDIVPLDEQDRSLWDRALIAEGGDLIAGAWRHGAVGPYQVQAAIAAVHDQAPCAEDTDWREIVALYGLLERMTANPMVSLNRAIATAMADGPAAGLAMLQALAQQLDGHHRYHSTRAHLLEMAGEPDDAGAEYDVAAARTASLPEQRYLIRRAARLRASP